MEFPKGVNLQNMPRQPKEYVLEKDLMGKNKQVEYGTSA
jgi:hypothetical protein